MLPVGTVRNPGKFGRVSRTTSRNLPLDALLARDQSADLAEDDAIVLQHVLAEAHLLLAGHMLEQPFEEAASTGWSSPGCSSFWLLFLRFGRRPDGAAFALP